MLLHLVLIEQAVSRHMQMLWQKKLRKGCSRQQGGTGYSCGIWSGGTDYSAVDSPGGLLSRGDCPRIDRYIIRRNYALLAVK